MTTTAAAPPKRREKGSSRRHTVHVVQKSGSETEDDDTIFRNASYYEDMNSSDTYKNTSDTEPETSPLDTVYYDEEKELDAFIGQLGISSTDNSNDETYAQERRAETAKRKYKPRKKTQETTILEPLKTTGKRRRRSSEKNAVSLPAQELAVEALPIEAVQEPPTPTPPPLQPPKVLCINFFDKTDYKSVQPPQLQQSNALQVQQPQQPQDITQQKEKEQQQQQPNKEEVDEKQEQKQSSPLPPPPQLQQQLQQKGLLTLRLPITCQTTPLLLSQTNSSQSVPQILTAIQSGATQFTPPSEKLQVSSAKFPTLQEKTILSYFPYVDPSLKEHEVERFLSRRTCLDTRTRKDGRQYHEFLTKYTGLSYRRCKWVPGDLFKPGTKAYTQLKMFETKWEKNLERSVSVENVIDVQKRATCSGYDESVVEFITPETILLSVSDPQKLFNDPHLPQTELYLVKWSGLRPLESTWETKESLCDDALIQWYKETEMAFDRKKHGWKKEDIMFERLQRYQTVGVAWAFKCYAEYKRNIILGDEFGLGKRVQAIFTLVNISKEVMRVGGHMPIFLIVTSTDIMENWLEEIQLYTSLKAISCYGNLDERTVVKNMLFYKDKPQNKDSHPEYLFNVLITTYEACVADDFLDRNTYPWEYVIFDEALRLRGPKTQKYFFKAKPPRFMLIASNPIFVETSPSHDAPMPDDGVEDVIATGSAVLSCDERKKKNILGDAWFLLNYVDKTAFPNYRTFEATDPEKMKALVSEYYLRRRRVYGQPQSESPSRVVFSQPKSKQHVPIHIEAVLADATPLQKAFLWRTYARNVPFLRKRKEPLCSVMLAMQDVSKCLIHPKLKEDNEGIKDSYFIDEKDGSSLQHTNDSNSSDNNDNDDDPSNSKMSGAPANESDISNSNSTKAALESAPKSSSGEMSSQNESTSKHLEIAAELKRQERQLLINREKEVMNNIFQDSGLACATSGKFLLLKHLIPGILEKGRKLLIFSNYTEALNVLYDELLSKMLGEKYPHYGKVLDETMHGNDVVMAIKSASASGPYAMLASTGLKPVWVLKLLSVFDIIVFLDLEIAESQWTENSLVNLVQMSLPPVDNAPKNIYYLLMRDSFESLYFKERCFTDDRYKSLCSRKAWVEALAKCSMSPFFKTEPAGARVVADFESVNGVNINDNNFWDTVFRVGDKRSFVDRVSAAEKADADKTFDHELIKHIIEDVQEVKCAEPGSVHNELTDAYESQESSCAITDTIPPPLPKNDGTQHEEQSPDEKGSAHSYSLKPNDESGSTKPTAVSVVEDKAETTTLQQFQLLPPPSKKKRRCSQQETASPPSEHSAQGLKVQIESSEQWKISEVERVIKGLISFGWGAWDKVQKEKLLTKTPESIVRISYALLSAILNAVPLGSSLVLAQKILGFRIDLPQDLSSELGLAQIFCPWHIMRADSLDMGGTLLGTGQSSVAATVGLGPGHFFEDDPVFRDPALLVNIREGGLDKLNSIALATEVNRLANAIANGYELRPLRPSTSQSWWTPGDDKQLIIGMQKWGIKPCFLEKIFRDSGLTFSVTFSKNRQTQKQCKQIPSPQAILLRARMVLNANRAWILPIVAAVDNAVAAAEQIASHSALDRVVSSLWAEKRDGSSGNCGDSCPAWWCSAADIGLVRGFSKLRGFTAKYLRADPSHLKAGKWDDENSSLEEALWVKVAEADPSHVVSTKYINAKAQITAKPGPMVFAPKDLLRRAGFFSLRGAVNRLFEICNVFEEWYCINYMSVVNATVLTTHDLPQNNRPLPVTGATAVPIAKAAAVPASSTYPKGKYPVTFVSFAPTTEGERRSVVVLNRTFLPICADINTALLFGSHRSANSDNGSSKLEELTVDLGMLRYSSATASLVLPIAIEGGLEVQDMGIIVPSFACESYVYPLGYKASRVINNPEKKKDDLIRCVCSIDINESAIVKTPLFRVAVPGTCVEFKGETPSEACTGLLVHWGYNPSSIPPGFGEEFFGLSNPLVVHVIQSSYRAALCVAYKPRHIKTIGQVLKVN